MTFYIGIHGPAAVVAACAKDLGLGVSDSLSRRIVDRTTRRVVPGNATMPWVELYPNDDAGRSLLHCLGAALVGRADAAERDARRWCEMLERHVFLAQTTIGIARMWMINDHVTIPANRIDRYAVRELEPTVFLRLGNNDVVIVEP